MKKISLIELTQPELRVLLLILENCLYEGWYFGRKDHWIKNLHKVIEKVKFAKYDLEKKDE